MAGKETQPAKISYFYGPGWKDLGNFIKTFWQYNKDAIQKKKEKFEGDPTHGVMSFKGFANFLSCMFMILFGTFFFAIISAAFSLVLSIAFCFVYVLIFFAWTTDRLFLARNKIFVACPNCKEKYLIPIYICPNCGAKHTKLTPCKYGTLYRICECGKKIPSHFLTKRGSLSSECPHCGTSLTGTESVPVCIPIVGGRSAGKTAFITAFTHEFIEETAYKQGLTVKHYNETTEKYYRNEICSDFAHGTTRMTQTEADVNRASSKAFDFFISSPSLKPERLIQIYDVDGESFISNSENELQLQYNYCHGIVFVLDPLSIPAVRNSLDDETNIKDRSSLGTSDIEVVLDSFLNKIREITGASTKDTSAVPLAIVISKRDIPSIDKEIGENAIFDYMKANNLQADHYLEAEDKLCRKYLTEMGMGNFVSNIDMKFKVNRYFACSAIGHTRETGAYTPQGILDPMVWLFRTGDSGIDKIWKELR